MGNVLSPEEEARWEEECKKMLFPFEINNAEFAEFGGSWKGLYDFIKQEDAQIIVFSSFLKAELDARVEKVQVIQQLQGVPEPHHPTNQSDMYHPSIIARDQAIVEALQNRVGRAMLLEFKYVALSQLDQALELGRQVLFAMQRRDFDFLRKNPKVSLPLDASLIKEYVDMSQLYNHMNGEGIMKQQIEPVLDELPQRYQMPSKARFNRSKSRGFSFALIELPWFSMPGALWVNIDTPASGGPPGFSGRVPVLQFVWKTGVKGPQPMPEDLRSQSSQGYWELCGFQMMPQHRKIKTTTLGSRGKNAVGSASSSANTSGTVTPQARSRGHSRRGSKDGGDSTSTAGRPPSNTTSPNANQQKEQQQQHHQQQKGVRGAPPGLNLLPIPEASSGAYVPPGRRRENSNTSTSTTPRAINSSPDAATQPKQQVSPRGKPITPRLQLNGPTPFQEFEEKKISYFFLDNNVLVSLARGDLGTLEWASQHEGHLFVTEVAREEYLTMGRTKLPHEVQFVQSGVPLEAQERAIQRIMAALSVTGAAAEKLKPDLRYLIQCSWVCWDERLSIPHDARVAFITFNMKFWRRVLQHQDKLQLIEYFLNDEGLEHLMEVAYAEDHILNHGRAAATESSPLMASAAAMPAASLAPVAGAEQSSEGPRAGSLL